MLKARIKWWSTPMVPSSLFGGSQESSEAVPIFSARRKSWTPASELPGETWLSLGIGGKGFWNSSGTGRTGRTGYIPTMWGPES